MQVIWCLKFCNMTKSGGTIPRSKFWGDLSPSPRDLRPWLQLTWAEHSHDYIFQSTSSHAAAGWLQFSYCSAILLPRGPRKCQNIFGAQARGEAECSNGLNRSNSAADCPICWNLVRWCNMSLMIEVENDWQHERPQVANCRLFLVRVNLSSEHVLRLIYRTGNKREWVDRTLRQQVSGWNTAVTQFP